MTSISSLPRLTSRRKPDAPIEPSGTIFAAYARRSGAVGSMVTVVQLRGWPRQASLPSSPRLRRRVAIGLVAVVDASASSLVTDGRSFFKLFSSIAIEGRIKLYMRHLFRGGLKRSRGAGRGALASRP